MKQESIQRFSQWVSSGAPWIWLNAAALSACILLMLGLLTLIAWRGLGHFWPTPVQEFVLAGSQGEVSRVAGMIRARETVSADRLRESGVVVDPGVQEIEQFLVKRGNRDIEDGDFVWLLATQIEKRAQPYNLAVIERTEWGVFIGRVTGLRVEGELLDSSDVWGEFKQRLSAMVAAREQLEKLEKNRIGEVNHRLERLRLREKRLSGRPLPSRGAISEIEAERAALQAQYTELVEEHRARDEAMGHAAAVVTTADGQNHEIALRDILDAWRPNSMNMAQKLGHYFLKIWEFLSDSPREANTEGGVFPAIFGTILMVLLMTLLMTPLGVMAAIYLREYARQGWATRALRIAVNNLAGVPSIVYGVFGLGFFIYAVGGTIDEWFFAEALPAPTFGTGGLIWASLTLALLTLPLVIVSTEEGLSRIPRSVREGSLALGATRWETISRTLLPMCSPAIMTGMILAIARAAGEVAPLMLVGVVKLAPSLPLDGNFPYLHLERKFMHLGFHIYDAGFQSPNVEAARPLVYATAFLLVIVTVLLNILAITLRNRLSDQYRNVEA